MCDELDKLHEVSKELDRLASIRRIAMDSNNLGYWDWNMVTDKLWWSEKMYEIYGVNPSDFTGNVSFWRDQLDKEGYERTQEVLENAIKNDEPFICFFTVRDRDYNPRKVFAVGNLIKKDGEPVRMVGINVLIPKDIDVCILKNHEEPCNTCPSRKDRVS